ncbi:MAG: nucleotidyl transferase AbiEii/AbiGii toxin family protein [Candidatus Omnitrophica bacterium]|nr:nucleotidyl transferase AbiEii/AbiGii toxin family protein [Candidatus Omnitrophota bacterium]
MIHKNKDEFIKVVELAATKKGFLPLLMEKDYYLTLILSKLNQLSEGLIFKGGTCLNKVYFSYYRLSEDLDFSMQLPTSTLTRGIRRKAIQPVKDKIKEFAEQFGIKLDETEEPGRNESKQYLYYFVYQSAVSPGEGKIKFEIGLRYNPILGTEKRKVQHHFLHPFTEEILFEGGEVRCLALKEVVAEKLRAAATRKTIAPRDFYDLDFILRKGFKIADPEVMELFQKKLAEDRADTDLAGYSVHLGRQAEEIKDMRSRIKEELFEVLTAEERKNFDLDAALKRINNVFKVVV